MLGPAAQFTDETETTEEVGRPVPLPILSSVVLVADLVEKVLPDLVARIGVVPQIRGDEPDELIVGGVGLVGWVRVIIRHQLFVAFERVPFQAPFQLLESFLRGPTPCRCVSDFFQFICSFKKKYSVESP